VVIHGFLHYFAPPRPPSLL